MMSEGSCMLSGGDSLKRNRKRSVSVSLFSCHLVSQSPMSGEGGGGVCGVYGVCAVSGCCLRDPVCCQGVIVSKQVEKGQLALLCSAETTR